jgi:malto-oligosyltrehalose trehalohydrolase
VALALESPAGPARILPLERRADGWSELVTDQAHAGSRYRFAVGGETLVPDPASRRNPQGVHGPSEVVDPEAFEWTDDEWRAPRWRDSVVYELHVGTFTPEGTFAGVADKLEHLQRLGVTAIELMPIAEFPGARGWGYDGVLPYAPASTYGSPEDLKALVCAAHAHGIAVILDVVYNHFGPEGNFLHLYAPQFFTDRHSTPWGAAMDFEGPDSRAVRDFFIHNALYWLEEYHLDGLRFDAVHAIFDAGEPHILSEIARAAHDGPGRERPVYLVLENLNNEARRLGAAGASDTFDAQWNDDVHHCLHVLLTGETDSFAGPWRKDSPIKARAPAISVLRAGSAAATCRPRHSSTSCRTTTRSEIAPAVSGCRSLRPRRPCVPRRRCCCSPPRRQCSSWVRSGPRQSPFLISAISSLTSRPRYGRDVCASLRTSRARYPIRATRRPLRPHVWSGGT